MKTIVISEDNPSREIQIEDVLKSKESVRLRECDYRRKGFHNALLNRFLDAGWTRRDPESQRVFDNVITLDFIDRE